MVWYDPSTWFKLDEDIKAFKTKGTGKTDTQAKNQSGEGIDDYTQISGYGVSGISSFNSFHNLYINKQYKNYVQKIANYRRMSSNTEINDVLCDMVNESIQKNDKNNVISLNIIDNSLNKKETVVKTLQKEFEELFFDRLDLNTRIESWMYNYYIDGRIYIENIINKARHVGGIINTKTLPPETMDTMYDQYGQLEAYIQYKKPNAKRPASVDDAMKNDDIIVFWPKQITHLRYDKNKGYLEMCKIPYNQLKLLETSMIIYRIVRAPERFVYKIDTGAMPKEKAMKFVEKVKNKMNKKETFDAETGTLQNNSDVLSIMDNIYLPVSDTRGSDVTSIGGNSGGFAELDDIYYFQKKLYRSLKYPLSRIENTNEGRSSDNLFRGNSMGEIVRDEIKWAKLLEHGQSKFSDMLVNLFLLHLDFKGLKKQYSLINNSFNILFTNPSNYKEQMEQMLLETRFENYMQLSNEEGFSKSFLQKRYLIWDDDTIQENADALKKDKELGLTSEDSMGF